MRQLSWVISLTIMISAGMTVQGHRTEPVVDVFNKDEPEHRLDNPRGLAFGPDGYLYSRKPAPVARARPPRSVRICRSVLRMDRT